MNWTKPVKIMYMAVYILRPHILQGLRILGTMPWCPDECAWHNGDLTWQVHNANLSDLGSANLSDLGSPTSRLKNASKILETLKSSTTNQTKPNPSHSHFKWTWIRSLSHWWRSANQETPSRTNLRRRDGSGWTSETRFLYIHPCSPKLLASRNYIHPQHDETHPSAMARWNRNGLPPKANEAYRIITRNEWWRARNSDAQARGGARCCSIAAAAARLYFSPANF